MNLEIRQVSPKEFQIVNKQTNKIIFETFDATRTPKEYLDLLGIQYENVYIVGVKHSYDNVDDVNEDDVIAKLNAKFTAPGLGKYRETLNENTNESHNDYHNTTQEKTTSKLNEPIGDVEIPELGNLIYVDSKNGILSKITAGIGTVSVVYATENEYEYEHQLDDDYDYDYSDDEEYDDDFLSTSEQESSKTIMIELEEIPGVYWNWNELRHQQTELKEKWGYKPAMRII